jgi:hypothetical protein
MTFRGSWFILPVETLITPHLPISELSEIVRFTSKWWYFFLFIVQVIFQTSRNLTLWNQLLLMEEFSGGIIKESSWARPLHTAETALDSFEGKTLKEGQILLHAYPLQCGSVYWAVPQQRPFVLIKICCQVANVVLFVSRLLSSHDSTRYNTYQLL